MILNHPVYFSLIILFLSSCTEDQHPLSKVDFPSLKIPSHFCLEENSYRDNIKNAAFKPLYLGPLKDTITSHCFFYNSPPPPIHPDSPMIDNYSSLYEEPFSNYTQQDFMEGGTTLWDSAVIQITIDTSIIIPSTNTYCTKAHPILLQSLEKDTICIGVGKYVELLLEALDIDNQWKAIQKPFRYGCGVGLNQITLPPHYTALVACPIFEGSFRTLLRLKIGKNYSSTFSGNIDSKQLISALN